MSIDEDSNRTKQQHDYTELKFQMTMCYIFARYFVANDQHDVLECIEENKISVSTIINYTHGAMLN